MLINIEVSVLQVHGFRWYALNDKQFKLTTVNLNFQYYYEVSSNLLHLVNRVTLTRRALGRLESARM